MSAKWMPRRRVKHLEGLGDPTSEKSKTIRSAMQRTFSRKRLLASAGITCFAAIAAATALYVTVEIPENGNEQARLQSNVYQYSDGSVMARTGKANREVVAIEKVPIDVRTAFIAIENKTFYEDHGVDAVGTARGLFSTLTGGGRASGSTITQQYVKNYYLTREQSVTRKVKELIIALKVDQRMSKDEILAGYLNANFYGRGAYGIQAASQAYYGVDVDKLSLEQGAYLAALIQAPSRYDWATADPGEKKLAMIRFDAVLDNMVDMGKLEAAKRKGMRFQEPISPRPALGLGGQKGYLVEAARREMNKRGVDDSDINAGGWVIRLNIDKNRQAQLEKAVADELESKLQRGDTKQRPQDQNVQAGATSVDSATGQIVAMYGGRGIEEKYLSNALRADYQPGSTFKPVVLASALENGATTQDGRRITPNTLYDGTSRRPVLGSSIPFAPQNQDNISYGDLVTVQAATNASMNSVYAQMIVDAKPERVKKTALSLGMVDREGWPEDTPAMSLGTMGANTVEMAGVYATLGQHGKKISPSIVKSATRRGFDIKPTSSVSGRVLSVKTADTVTKVLIGVVNNGSGAAARSPKYQAAGKTGTAESNVAAWFTGYTPELVTVVALFGEEPGTHRQVTLTGMAGQGRAGGSGFPARIWKAYTLAALQGQATGRFDLPDADMGPLDHGERAPAASPTRTPTSPGPSPSPFTSSPGPTGTSPTEDQDRVTPGPTPSATRPTPSKTETVKPTSQPKPSKTTSKPTRTPKPHSQPTVGAQ
ncbi:transglycosylase domain-containing protein [Streptomyces virginiae]|uniref:transglycosylase domain-containing protein n=1 Tax=Streptomyces virginiae TaxID=1961 RepID=UPI00099C79CA|nr:transglycosylase domain-containing protein [Streptomyces virginiae]